VVSVFVYMSKMMMEICVCEIVHDCRFYEQDIRCIGDV